MILRKLAPLSFMADAPFADGDNMSRRADTSGTCLLKDTIEYIPIVFYQCCVLVRKGFKNPSQGNFFTFYVIGIRPSDKKKSIKLANTAKIADSVNLVLT